MRRRAFITLLGSTAAVWPFAAHSQQTDKRARVGVFVGSFNPIMAPAYKAFLEELDLATSRGPLLIAEP